jgi:tetratricopeptide (TPR) repeat protein
MTFPSRTVATFLMCLAASAFAAGGGGGGGGGGGDTWGSLKSEDPVVSSAQRALAAGDFAGAQLMLKVALASNSSNADLHNLYAYAIRKGPNPDMDLVFKHYEEGLRIDPKHRGAHEYIGEAYLMVNNLAKAKEHLAALDRLCFFGCTEYTDLKLAISAHEVRLAKAAAPTN